MTSADDGTIPPGGVSTLLNMQRERLDDEAHSVHEAHIALTIKSISLEMIKLHGPSAEELQWVRLAIKREARRERFQQAVIEKTLSGLVWAALVLVAVAMWEFVISHASLRGG